MFKRSVETFLDVTNGVFTISTTFTIWTGAGLFPSTLSVRLHGFLHFFCINYNCEKISQQHPSKHAAFHPTQPLELSGSCKIHLESHKRPCKFQWQNDGQQLVLATPCKASLLSTSYRLNMQFLKVISKNPTRKSISWSLFQESGSKTLMTWGLLSVYSTRESGPPWSSLHVYLQFYQRFSTFLSFGDPQNTVTLCFTTASGHRNLDLDCQQYNKEVAPISLLLLYNKTSQKHALPVSIWISCPNIQPTTNMQNVHQVTRSWDLCAQCTSHVNSEVPVGPGWGASKEWYLVADSSPSS